MSENDLIVAPATVAAGGGRGIVRLAGEAMEQVLRQIVEEDASAAGLSPGRPRLIHGRLHPDGLGHAWGRVPVAVVHWPGPTGPLGGPLAEIHLPGSPPLVAAVVAEACRLGGRLARGGEFSLRSFLAGRLDLLQAEAVLAIVDARSPGELSAALDRMAGGVGAAVERARQEAVDLVADVEAAIDFADEAAPDAVPVVAAWGELAGRIARLEASLADIAAVVAGRDASGESLPRAVLVGRPNIGKSSLFNSLVGRAAALVADESGTTRDWIAAPLFGPDGQAACLLVDSAGVPDANPGDEDALQGMAIARAREEIARADVIVACRDIEDALANAPLPAGVRAAAVIVPVVTRIDTRPIAAADSAILTSARDAIGIDETRAAILGALSAAEADRLPATLRLRAGLAAAEDALAAAGAAVAEARVGRGDEAIVAGCLHRVIDALGDVTGRHLGTDLLDRIFSRHCIGK